MTSVQRNNQSQTGKYTPAKTECNSPPLSELNSAKVRTDRPALLLHQSPAGSTVRSGSVVPTTALLADREQIIIIIRDSFFVVKFALVLVLLFFLRGNPLEVVAAEVF